MKAILIPAALCASQLAAVAGPSASLTTPISTPPATHPWEFRLTPYAWLTAIDGTTGPENFTANLDAGFDDIFDVLEMAAAFQFEARRDRWGLIADAFYAELGNSGTLSGELQADVDVNFKQFLGELVVFYRVSESPHSFVDLYAGGRYNSLSLDLDVTTHGQKQQRDEQRSADKGWVDPIIGLRTQWEINDRWYLAARGDIGGFGVESDFIWNLQGTVGYRFNECASAELGYRYFDTDYSKDHFVYDIAQAGAVIAFNFEF